MFVAIFVPTTFSLRLLSQDLNLVIIQCLCKLVGLDLPLLALGGVRLTVRRPVLIVLLLLLPRFAGSGGGTSCCDLG